MHLLRFFLNLSDWFLKNKSGINFLGLKTKLALICNNANTDFLKVFIQLFLKELRNYTQSYFCIRHNNRRKHNQYFKTAVFHDKFTLLHIKPSIYRQKTKFASLKQYLFRLLFSRNSKKTQTDQSMPQVFLVCLKKNDPQTFKSSSCKTVFVYVIGTTCFDECFSFYVITKRHSFS